MSYMKEWATSFDHGEYGCSAPLEMQKSISSTLNLPCNIKRIHQRKSVILVYGVFALIKKTVSEVWHRRKKVVARCCSGNVVPYDILRPGPAIHKLPSVREVNQVRECLRKTINPGYKKLGLDFIFPDCVVDKICNLCDSLSSIDELKSIPCLRREHVERIYSYTGHCP